MAAHRNPITVNSSISLRLQFLKGSVEVHKTIIFENNKMRLKELTTSIVPENVM